jgi:hypothetical protein
MERKGPAMSGKKNAAEVPFGFANCRRKEKYG